MMAGANTIGAATHPAPRSRHHLVAATLVSLFLFTPGLLQAAGPGRELIRDPHFQNGFLLLEPKPGKRVVYGAASEAAATAQPVWDIGQWSSKFPLNAARTQRLPNGVLSFTNIAKRVCVGAPGGADADLSLGVNASAEYGNHARKSQAEPWVHLLVQQDIQNPPSLAELAACRIHVEARLKHSKLFRTDDYSPSRHAAQFLLYVTVANRNPNSPGYGQYLWLGIPVYDDRSRIAPSYQAEDFGDTKMFIYTLASEAFTKESTHDGRWVTFAGDLVPLMREGLQAGWKAGFMAGSRELADYRLTGIFIGWEVPGIFDVEVQLRNLSLAAFPNEFAPASQPDYVSDHPELILSSTQDWGVLGFNTAAHVPEKEGAPLQIGEKTFARGFGHHANGIITLMTENQYESFDAEVGVQPCASGSVIFRIMVDGQQRFDSGVIHSGEAPKPVHVSVAGAQEVRLEARDAGDGVSCDMANWAEARLTLAANATNVRPTETSVDMAPFARVVTWDPRRMDGARASRIEEFRADDLFTETELRPNRTGNYAVPMWTNGVGCIGLQWLNRRALRELALTFATEAQMPPTDSVRAEGWFGESAWQGNWKPLTGEYRRDGNRLTFRLAPKAGVVQTQKIRWVLPRSPMPPLVHPLAFTRSSWATTNLFVQVEKPKPASRGEVTIWNGEPVAKSETRKPQRQFQNPDGVAASRQSAALVAQEKEMDGALPRRRYEALKSPPTSRISWRLSEPLHLTVRYSRPSSFRSDPTVLQLRLPTGNVSVAVEDVLANDCVYLPDHGLFVAREPLPVTLADYRHRLAGRQTILEAVRALPDQTLAQAMEKTHHDAQREGPVLLSLACDNTKFIVERDGAVRWVVTTNAAIAGHETRLEMKPRFGDAKSGVLSRTLDGAWLPIPVITVTQDGLEYRQRTFVAPCDEPGGDIARLNRSSVCVVEFTVTNTLAQPANAVLSLLIADRRAGESAMELVPHPRGWLVRHENETLALAATTGTAPLAARASGDTIEVAGTLPPNGAAQFTLFLPAQTNIGPDSLYPAPLRTATEAYWNAVLAPTMQIETPDELLNNVIRSSPVRCLIAARNEADGARVAAWIAAMSYGPLESEAHAVIRGMDFMGHSEFARRSLEFFIHRYNTNGFLTTGYTTFGTAWHLWTLGEHYRLSRDKNWLRQDAPELARVGHWIVRQTEKTKKFDARGQPLPEFGLMPPGVLADWNSFACHFAMNAYYSAALRELGAALGDIGHPDAGFFKRHASELRENTRRAYAWTQSRAPALALHDGTWIPHYPSQVHSPGKLGDFFPGQDAGRSWCYDVELGAHQLVPTGVLDPRSREVERMMDHMEDVQFLADGWFDYPATMNHTDWFNLGGFSKVQPYYTRNCEIYALRDDVKPFVRSYFNTLAAMLNPEVLTMWEHFHHSGAWDKTHETGYFLHQTRTMLVQERGNELWLAPFVTSNWLRDGQRISVKNAPTRFGPVSYEIISHIAQGFIEARIEPPTRQKPEQVVLRLRHPDGKQIQSATLNGRRHRVFDPESESISIKPTASAMTLRAQF